MVIAVDKPSTIMKKPPCLATGGFHSKVNAD
jgi:hypothetical protein